jgi:acyl-CoA hydrolase
MACGKRETILTFIAEPTSANFAGNVHGGSVMKWLDHAGYACAAGWSGRYCVTANVGGIQFLKPIHVGNLVRVSAKIIYTGTSSMHVLLDVSATDPREDNYQSTTRCIMVFVAMGDNNKSVAVQPWVAETENDKALAEAAMRLMDSSRAIQEDTRAAIDAGYE